MNSRQISCFLAVAEHLHFRRAAESLSLTQPALSLQLQSLEKEIGVQLVRRNRHGTSLTFAGKVFRAEIGDVVAASERAADRAKRASSGSYNHITVGFISTATTTRFLPRLVTGFRRAHPHIELTLQHHVNADQPGMIESGRLDVGIIRLPIMQFNQLELVTVHSEPHVLLLSEHHPMSRKRTITPRDLAEAPFIMYARRNSPGYHDFLMHSLNRMNVSPTISHEVGDMYTLASLVSSGMGVAVVPLSTKNYNLPGLLHRPLRWLPRAEMAVAFRRDDKRPATRLLIDTALGMRQVSQA